MQSLLEIISCGMCFTDAGATPPPGANPADLEKMDPGMSSTPVASPEREAEFDDRGSVSSDGGGHL